MRTLLLGALALAFLAYHAALATNSTYSVSPTVFIRPPFSNSKLILTSSNLTVDPAAGRFYLTVDTTYSSPQAVGVLPRATLIGTISWQQPGLVLFSFSGDTSASCSQPPSSPALCPYLQTLVNGPFYFGADPSTGATVAVTLEASTTYIDPVTNMASNFLGANIPLAYVCIGSCEEFGAEVPANASFTTLNVEFLNAYFVNATRGNFETLYINGNILTPSDNITIDVVPGELHIHVMNSTYYLLGLAPVNNPPTGQTCSNANVVIDEFGRSTCTSNPSITGTANDITVSSGVVSSSPTRDVNYIYSQEYATNGFNWTTAQYALFLTPDGVLWQESGGRYLTFGFNDFGVQTTDGSYALTATGNLLQFGTSTAMLDSTKWSTNRAIWGASYGCVGCEVTPNKTATGDWTVGGSFCLGTTGDTCMRQSATRVMRLDPLVNIILDGNSTANAYVAVVNGNLRLGTPTGTTQATTATTGWPLMPAVSGPPTGIPIGTGTGTAAHAFDQTNKRPYWFDQPSNTWKGAIMGVQGTTNQVSVSTGSNGIATITLFSTFIAPGSITSTTNTNVGTVITGGGTKPSFVFGLGANCASSATGTLDGTNQMMYLSFTTGTGSCGVNSNIAVFTFGATAGVTTRWNCAVNAAQGYVPFWVDSTATTFSIRSSATALDPSTLYAFQIGPCSGY